MYDVGSVITLKYLRHVFCIRNGIFFLGEAISGQTSEPFAVLLRDSISPPPPPLPPKVFIVR